MQTSARQVKVSHIYKPNTYKVGRYTISYDTIITFVMGVLKNDF